MWGRGYRRFGPMRRRPFGVFGRRYPRRWYRRGYRRYWGPRWGCFGCPIGFLIPLAGVAGLIAMLAALVR